MSTTLASATVYSMTVRVAVVTELRGLMGLDLNKAPFEIPGVYFQKIIPQAPSFAGNFACISQR